VGHPLPLTLQSNAVMFVSTCGIVLIVSILTGTYPALLISVQKPADTLKGNVNKNVGSDFLRKGLVVAQFAISVVILIATIVVQEQLHFLDNKGLGFDKNNLMHLGLTSWDGKGQAFKQEVLGISGVKNATLTTWVPTQGGGWMWTKIDDPHQKNNQITVWEINADFDFIPTMKLHLQKGRLLDPKFGADAVNADSLMGKDMGKLFEAQNKQPIIVTDFTARALNITELNKPISKVSGIPVGIISDFNNESLKIDMKPLFIRASNDVPFGYLMIRNQPGTDKQVVAALAKIWRQFFPDKVFQYNWIDDLLKDQYKAEYRLQQLFTLFSFLVLFLASLGLFGLTIFTAELKVKEIGIRKVLGASVTRITVLLSRDFIKPVLLAIVIAAPVGWYAMNKWLQDYPYRISSTWWIFILSAFIAVFIAVATISFQTIKAALANPVESLRSE
jgi:putative ABC transport system permease protein